MAVNAYKYFGEYISATNFRDKNLTPHGGFQYKYCYKKLDNLMEDLMKYTSRTWKMISKNLQRKNLNVIRLLSKSRLISEEAKDSKADIVHFQLLN